MATRVQPWLVGLFTLFGLALMVGGFVLLGTGRLFSQYRTFVVFFEDPIGGLKEGSPVTFRLTPIGQVREMELIFSGQGLNSELKVVIDVRKNALRDRGVNSAISKLGDKEFAEALVKAGLRAGIHSSSPVAGQKSLNLDLLPERKARFSGIPAPYPEIPTAPSGLKMLQEKIESTIDKITDVPVNEVVIQLKDTLASAQTLLDSQDVKGAIKDLRQGLQSADKTLTASSKAMGNVDGLVGDLRTTVSSLDTTIKRLDSTFDKLDRTLTTADKTLSTADKTLVTVDRTVDQTMDIQYDAKKVLDELNELLRSVRHFIESVQKNPESILRGKPTPEKK